LLPRRWGSGLQGVGDDDWLDVLDYAVAEEGKDGPPANWPYPSWFDFATGEWYWKGKPDPCPVKPIGYAGGLYCFVTGPGEVRKFTAGQLHGSGGPADLFSGQMAWPRRHFRKWDPEKEAHIGNFQKLRCMAAMIRSCTLKGYIDSSSPMRSVGTWRGPDGTPVVHTGDRIFCGDQVLGPGELIGDYRYVVGGARQAPAHEEFQDGRFAWLPAPIGDCHKVIAHLDEWHWLDLEGRDLFAGGLWCDMLGDVLLWKPHRFVRAMPGSGKTHLLRYHRALLGGAAHPIQRTYSKARLEEHFAHTSCALLLEEAESDTEAERLRKVMELARLLSDEGATGGRFQREIDLHGSVTMVATLTEAWRPQDRRRFAYLELRPLNARANHSPITPPAVVAMIEQAAELSPAIRARALVLFDVFQRNLALARARVLELGGSPGDADQLGHLIAGWATMTSETVMMADDLRALERFKPYILTVMEEEDGTDDSSELLNTLLGLPAIGYHKGGQEFTLGQLIARAREPDDHELRRALLPFGLRLERIESELTGQIEPWPLAWLAIANKHPKLEKLLTDYPQYRTPKRAQILSGLSRMVDGVEQSAKPSARPLKFAGPQSRAWLIPPVFLPSLADEGQDPVKPGAEVARIE
jgi:hypothetical protein